MRFIIFAIAAVAWACASSATVGSAQSTVSYRLLVDGAEVNSVGPGTYELQVQARVTGNDLASLGLPGVQGGLLQYDQNVPAAPGLSFQDIGPMPFPDPDPGGDGTWESIAAAAFVTHFQGLVDVEVQGTAYALFAEVGATAPSDINNNFMRFGSQEFTTIVSGYFTYDFGEPSGMLTLEPTRTGTLIAVPNATNDGVRAALPDTVVGAHLTLQGIPEPASAVLIGLAVAGLAFIRRR